MLPKYEQPKLSPYLGLYDILIPANHFLRQFLNLVDFSFIYDELESKYCPDDGRNAESPIRLFKYLILKIMYRLSDADLIERCRSDLLFKFFLGLAPEDDVIHPSTLSKFRKLRLKDPDLLDFLIKKSVQIAIEHKVIGLDTIIVDATHTRSRYTLKDPYETLMRSAKDLRLAFCQYADSSAKKQLPSPKHRVKLEEAMDYCTSLVESIQSSEKIAQLPGVSQRLHYLQELLDDQSESMTSTGDPDARVGYKKADEPFYGYKTDIAMTEDRIIVAANIMSGEKNEGHDLKTLVEKSREAGLTVETVIADTAYSGKENLQLAESKENPEKGFKLVSKLNPVISDAHKNPERNGFTYNKDANTFACPAGHLAIKKSKTTRNQVKPQRNSAMTYTFDVNKCKHCPRYGTCCKAGAKSKTYSVIILSGEHQKQFEYQETEEFKELARTRYKIEAKNAELKNRYGYNVAHSSGITGMVIQGATTIFVANIRRILRLIGEKE